MTKTDVSNAVKTLQDCINQLIEKTSFIITNDKAPIQ